MCPNAAEADQFMQFELVSSKNRRVDDTAAINVTVIDVGFLSDCRDEGMTNSQSSILNRTIAGQNKSASCCYDGEKNGLSFFSQNSHTISSEISIQEKMQGLPANMNERDAAKFPSSILIQSSECSRSFPIKKGNEKQFSNVQQQSATGNNKHFFSGSEMGEAVAMNSASLLFSSIFNNSDDGRGVVDILKSNSNQDEEEW